MSNILEQLQETAMSLQQDSQTSSIEPQAKDMLDRVIAELEAAIKEIKDATTVVPVNNEYTQLFQDLRFIANSFEIDEYNVNTILYKTGEKVSGLWNASEIVERVVFAVVKNSNKKLEDWKDAVRPLLLFVQSTLEDDVRLGLTTLNKTKGSLPTPTLKASKLTSGLQTLVRSPKFIAWFGDWQAAADTGDYTGVSKMIDPDTKEPQVVFHGTSYDKEPFTSFKLQYYKRPAIYVSPDYEYAKWYADADKTRGDRQAAKASNTPYVYELFAALKNPIDLRFLGETEISGEEFIDIVYVLTGYDLGKQPNVMQKFMNIRVPTWAFFSEESKVLETLRTLGEFDSIMFIGFIPDLTKGTVKRTAEEIIIFHPSKIKSVNAFMFNPNITDIRFAKGGQV
jgi:hypothetical protein